MDKRDVFFAVVLLASAIHAPNLFGQTADAPASAAGVTNNLNSAPTPETPVGALQTNTDKTVEKVEAVALEATALTVTQGVQVATSAVVGAESPISAIVPEISDAGKEPLVPWEEPESRTRRAMRVNREILLVTVPILAFFVIARIALLWKISSNRKRIARESNTLEP